MSAADELDPVEHRRPVDVRELVRADHRLRRRVDEHAQRRRRTATRQRRHAHVEAGRRRAADRSSVISSHASSWPRMTWPRRVPPGRASAGSMRSSRAVSSSSRARLEPALTIACSIGTSSPFGPDANTARCHAFAVVGRVEAHDQPLALAGDRRAPTARPASRSRRRSASARRTRCRRDARSRPRRRRRRCERAEAARAARAAGRCRGRSRRPCR